MKKTLLVVDDDPVFRRYVKNSVTPLGLEVVEASRGLEATFKQLNRNPDAIIVDGLLPDTDGVSWIREYRKSGGDAVVLYASAFRADMTTHLQLTKELRVDVLRKPVSAAELVATLARLLKIEHVVASSTLRKIGWMAWEESDNDLGFCGGMLAARR